MSNAINELKKMLLEAAAAQKKSQEPNLKEEIIITPTAIEEEDVVKKTMNYLNSPCKSEPIVRNVAENIETQRWNDPLRREPSEKFVTFKEMNDHYGLFLQRIQQQMSSIGGGGEVNFSRLDDVSTAGISTNKFLTYNSATKKFTFDYIPVGDGLELDTGTINLKINSSFDFETNGELKLKPAALNRIGGVKEGPGVTINSEGQILIDSTGLEFSFGDFQGIVGEYSSNTEYALLSSVNEDEDICIASNGDGVIKVVGQFDIYKTNGTVTGSLEDYEPFFRVKDDGQVRMLVPAEDPVEGAVEIVGSATGTYIPPGQAGAMLQITGNPELPARVYLDGNAEYASFVARRFNGTVASPTAVLANQDVFRINATAATSSGMGGVALGQIRITALENQTPTAQGSKMVFTVTPIGSAATSRVDVATITTADGVSATKFTGPLTGNVTGDVTGNVSGSAGSVAAANVTGTTLANNVVTSSLTSVGTLGSLTVTNLVTARNYNGQARNAGTLGAAGTLTIDFATDHNVLVNLTTTATIAFSNITAGKTVTVLVKNDTGSNRAVTTGVNVGNQTGNNTAPNVNDERTGVFIYRTFGTTTSDVYVEISV